MLLCGMFAASFVKLQKLLNEVGGLLFYRTGLRPHTCCRYSHNREGRQLSTSKDSHLRAAWLKSQHLTCLLELCGLDDVRCRVREPVHQSALTHVRVLQGYRVVWSNSSRLQFRAACVIMTWRVDVALEVLHTTKNARGQHQKRAKWDDWTLSQTSATGSKCRETWALSNVHQKPVWGSTLFTLLSWVTALRHRFMVVWNLPCH